MKEDKKAISRFENNKKLSIHERWKQDSDTFTIECKDGKRRTLKERRELRKKGIDV